MSFKYSEISKRIVRSEIREILKWSRKPGVISFGGGLPDPDLFPIEDIIDITKDVLTNKGYLALQYGPTKGEDDMLDALKQHMAEFGDRASTEEICITSSSQQGLDLLSMLFLDENEPIIMELPSYLGAIQAFKRSGADMRGIPMDDEGMDIEFLIKVLDELQNQGKKPRFIYTIPDFQNPSGITMSLNRRNNLIEIAHEREILILEDSPYRELSFTNKTLPSLWMLSEGKGVIMLKTFSKILFPGMRMGWMVGENVHIEKIIMLKQSVDLCTPSFNQLILGEYIKKGKMKKTIEKAIACYQPKSVAMLSALEKNMPEEISWSKPTGGMFLWLRLPERIDTKEIFMNAIENNVAYVIGRPFHCDNSGANTMRLNYSFPSIEQIEKGIHQLAKTIEKVL
ncbi:MAG: PLP-dependent aminotransferase family protein [Candidatus Aminicenantes bacterium]|nr:PLP-dependent aminotransferase family protein [Candidatus Aminicenantes bacterium]